MSLTNIDALVSQAQYRGMASTQSRVTRAWLLQNATRFDRVEFEVHVGKGATPKAEWPESTRTQFLHQTQKRIDVVAWAGDFPVIVEVKKQLNVAAIGQCLAYRVLWMADNPGHPEPSMVMVGETADQDVITAAHLHAIDVELYPVESA